MGAAKLHFTGDYAGGFDEFDQKHLETSFPIGTIEDVTFDNVNRDGDRANLDVTVQRGGKSTYMTSVSLVRTSDAWKIDYDGFNWPFPPK